jgi:hypothetical protein
MTIDPLPFCRTGFTVDGPSKRQLPWQPDRNARQRRTPMTAPSLLRLATPALMLAALAPAHAATFCVDDANELQVTLQAALSNNEDDIVRLEAGIYRSTSPDGFVVQNFSDADHDLDIIGGWTANCGLRLPGLRSTIDGDLERPGLTIAGTVDTRGKLTIRHMQFIRGLSENPNRAGGLTINRGYDILIESNLFRDNTVRHANSGASGGLYALSEGSNIIRGNLFVDNDADSQSAIAAGAASVHCYSFTASASFTNNTVTGNTADVGADTDIGGVRVYGVPNCAWTVANNILWGNPGLDLANDVDYTSIRYNDLEDRDGTYLPVNYVGNVRVDPRFVSATNFRLQRISPLVDGGMNAPAGGLPGASFDGGPRVVGPRVDMGAYELDVLFANGFNPSGFGLQ